MKKILFFGFVILTVNMNAQLKVTNVGRIGIGNNSPQYKLDLEGTMRISNWTDVIIDWSGLCSSPSIYPQTDWYLQLGYWGHQIGNIFTYGMHTQNIWWDSDSTFKTNFSDISNSISDLNKIKGYKYQFKDEYLKSIPDKEKSKYDRFNYGFKAQEIEKVYPELCQKDDSTDKYSINYIGFIPLLVNALNQQQNIIDAQSLKIKELDDRLAKIEGKSDSKSTLKSASSVSSDTIQSNKSQEVTNNLTGLTNTFLYQNNPNPFSERTEINYFIDEGVKTSLLMIFDMQGVLKKQVAINTEGFGFLIIQGSEFNAGMYIYTLVCDGKEIDTKRMILTD